MQREGEEHRARQRHRHAVAGLDAAFTQQPRQRHHLLTHLPIAELPGGIRQRRGIRRFRRLFSHQGAERRRRQRHAGIIDLRQLRRLVGRKQIGLCAA